MEIKATLNEAGERLDKFLTEKLEFSRSQIQKQIKAGEITLNDKNVTPHCFLKEGDVIKFLKKKTLKNAEDEKPDTKKNFKIKIIADTENYVVIDKPAGLAVHKSGNIKETTLADLLLKKFPDIKNVGEDPQRPGIVHRLDKDVSGLIVVAKTQKSFLSLKKQFQNRKVEKKYIALVYGKIDKDKGIINFPLERATSGHKIAALPLTKKGEANLEGREAITEFSVQRKYINYTFLEVIIKTGRTHQIRAHMAAFGHPIVGDDLYGTNRNRIKNKKFNLGRIFLVAKELSFKDLAGKKQSFKIEIPESLKKLLEEIK